MARRYYDTKEKVYNLLKTHPSTASFITEYGISNSAVQDVASYLIRHDKELQETTLSAYYQDSDLIDEIANLYGFTDGPWTKYVLKSGVTLLELLQSTIYIYKFGTSESFFEKNILNFIPEYDREQILANPKLKLTVQGLGRKLDQLEDQITRLSELYDIDKCPEEFLDYLGQNLGYEREDYTLSSVSFRELLKNIVEIYKIKGTNYSFSFFFKFLGFEINLKEFYYNRDVANPCAFPGMTINDVEYYLSATNPMMETGNPSQGIHLNPVDHLGQIRNIDDWRVEFDSIEAAGCTNTIKYMQGFESYNNAGVKWHANPWTYFKTNLIEYGLSSFMNKMSLTSSDNETIKKYIKFLSPTYLFTWININLAPWMEDINVVVDPDSAWIRTIDKVLGDPRPTPTPWPMFPQNIPGIPENNTGVFNRKEFAGPYKDYEDVGDIALFKVGGEVFIKTIEKALNFDKTDQFGTTLRRNGEHTRLPNSPKYIADAKHYAKKRLCFDSLDSEVKLTTDENYISFSSSNLPPIPKNISPKSGKIITTSNIPEFFWEDSFNATYYWIQIATSSSFANTNEWKNENLIFDKKSASIDNLNVPQLHNNKYYWRLRVRNNQSDNLDRDINENDWYDYIHTPSTQNKTAYYVHKTGWGPWSDIYSFTIDTVPFPYLGEIINRDTEYVSSLYQYNSTKTLQLFAYATIPLKWKSSLRVDSYEIEFTDGSTLVNALSSQKELLTAQTETISVNQTNISNAQNAILISQEYYNAKQEAVAAIQIEVDELNSIYTVTSIVALESSENLVAVQTRFNEGNATQEEVDAAISANQTAQNAVTIAQNNYQDKLNELSLAQIELTNASVETINKQNELLAAEVALSEAQAQLIVIQNDLNAMDQTATETSGYTDTIISVSNTISKNFTNGSYYWRYRAKDIDGIYNNWSEEFHFTVDFINTK